MDIKKFKFKREFITHNFWLKVISLIIAIVIWLYISGEIIRGVKV